MNRPNCLPVFSSSNSSQPKQVGLVSPLANTSINVNQNSVQSSSHSSYSIHFQGENTSLYGHENTWSSLQYNGSVIQPIATLIPTQTSSIRRITPVESGYRKIMPTPPNLSKNKDLPVICDKYPAQSSTNFQSPAIFFNGIIQPLGAFFQPQIIPNQQNFLFSGNHQSFNQASDSSHAYLPFSQIKIPNVDVSNTVKTQGVNFPTITPPCSGDSLNGILIPVSSQPCSIDETVSRDKILTSTCGISAKLPKSSKVKMKSRLSSGLKKNYRGKTDREKNYSNTLILPKHDQDPADSGTNTNLAALKEVIDSTLSTEEESIQQKSSKQTAAPISHLITDLPNQKRSIDYEKQVANISGTSLDTNESSSLAISPTHVTENPLLIKADTVQDTKSDLEKKILTHVIDGLIIHESSHPFPVTRGFEILDSKKIPKNIECLKNEPALSNEPTSVESNQDEINTESINSKKSLKFSSNSVSKCSSETAVSSECSVSANLNFIKNHPSTWTADNVCEFVSTTHGCEPYANEFKLQEIDGQALMLLNENHLMSQMGFKLGPALKMICRINQIKEHTTYER